MSAIIGFLSSASIILPVLFGVYATKQTRFYRALFFFFVFGLATEIAAYSLVQHHLSNNLWLYNIYELVEGVFWVVIFGAWLKGKFTVFSYPLSFVFFIVWVYTTLIRQSIFDYNSIFPVAESIVLIPLSAYCLLELTRKVNLPLVKVPEFWFAGGVLFYFSTTSIIHASADFIFEGEAMMHLTWYIHSLFNIITNLIFAKAFLCIPRKMT